MTSYKKDFPLLKERDIAYLDSGSTSQKPSVVMKAIEQFYNRNNANPHRGMYPLGMDATAAYDEARQKIAGFINAETPEQVIFTKNASEAANLVAYSYGFNTLHKGDEVVVSIMEHHSCIVPWQTITKKTGGTLSYLYMDDQYQIPMEEVKAKITQKTKIVCITHVSNVLGTINDVKAIVEHAHQMGAVVLVDASQSIPHMQVDVQAINADFLIFSGHKMLGPLGIGVLYGKTALLEGMEPFLMGGDMIEYVYEQSYSYAELPNKFEAGTQNVEGAVGLLAAVDYINEVGYAQIQKIDEELSRYAREELAKLPYITCYLTPNPENHCAVVSFNMNGVHPHDVTDILSRYGVCLRAGNHCAQPLLRFMGVDSTCRASFYLYNTLEDVDRLVEALKKVYAIFEKYLPKK